MQSNFQNERAIRPFFNLFQIWWQNVRYILVIHVPKIRLDISLVILSD